VLVAINVIQLAINVQRDQMIALKLSGKFFLIQEKEGKISGYQTAAADGWLSIQVSGGWLKEKTSG
jgi:hypothetical protein